VGLQIRRLFFSLQRDRLQKLRDDYPDVAIYGFDLSLQALRSSSNCCCHSGGVNKMYGSPILLLTNGWRRKIPSRGDRLGAFLIISSR
jgi:hypothetical protein